MLLDLRFIPGSFSLIIGKTIDLFLFDFLFFPWLQTSDTHTKMIEILRRTNFITQEFILSPLQFGVPYSRPRYFCLVVSSLSGS